MMRGLLAGLLLAVLIARPAWGQVTTQAPSSGSPWTLTYPTSPGTSGYVLSTDGTGVTSWISNAGTATTKLSSVTAATATNAINNTLDAQIWQWGTLWTQTAMTLITSSMTTGTLLSRSRASHRPAQRRARLPAGTPPVRARCGRWPRRPCRAPAA